jgi:hypothetical protein
MGAKFERCRFLSCWVSSFIQKKMFSIGYNIIFSEAFSNWSMLNVYCFGFLHIHIKGRDRVLWMRYARRYEFGQCNLSWLKAGSVICYGCFKTILTYPPWFLRSKFGFGMMLNTIHMVYMDRLQDTGITWKYTRKLASDKISRWWMVSIWPFMLQLKNRHGLSTYVYFRRPFTADLLIKI